MKSLKFAIFSMLFLFLGGSYSFASHVSGGDITYVYTGIPNTYTFTLSLYRDCSGIDAPVTPTLNFQSDCGGFMTVNFPNFLVEEISAVDTSQCPGTTVCNGGNIPGMELYQYQATVTLDPPCDSWTVSYSLSARNGSVNTNGGTFYTQTVLNTVTNPTNSSPSLQWTPNNGFDPIPYGCVNSPKFYALNVVEIDGDSLVFSLVSAQTGAGQNVTYTGGYSAGTPIPNMTINPNTGLMSFTAAVPGNYVVAILIEEFDVNGNLIGSMIHDFQFVVEVCTNNAPVAPNNVINYTNINTNANLDTVNNVISMCAGDAFCFDLTFTDPDGDEIQLFSNVQDILPNSTFSYTSSTNGDTVVGTVCWNYQPGYSGSIINVTANELICIPGSATFSVELDIPPALNLSPDDSICGIQTAQILASGQGPLTWSVISGEPMVIGTNFSCQNCVNPVATPTITTTYLLEDASSCFLKDTITITVADNYGDIHASIFTPDTSICLWECVDVDGFAEEDYTGTYTYPWNVNCNTFYLANQQNARCSLFVVAQGALTTISPGSIQEVCLDITQANVTHINVYLNAPNGQQYLLSQSNGGTGANYSGTCFQVGATTPINGPSGFAPFLTPPGGWIPEAGPLENAFIGAPVQGFWSIEVDHNNPIGSAGTINSWSIKFVEPFSFPIAASFFAWSNPDGMPANSTIDPTVCPQIGGEYILTAYNIDYCFTSDTIDINLHPLPDAGNDTTVQVCLETGTIDLFNYLGGTPLNVGTWQDANGNPVNPVMNSANVLDSLPYLYVAESVNGCLDSAYLIVDIIEVIIDNTIPVDASCFTFCDGEISTISPNATHYSIDNGPLVAVNVFDNLCSGLYDMQAYYELPDGAYCMANAPAVTINEPNELLISSFTALGSNGKSINPATNSITLCKENKLTNTAIGQGGNPAGTYVFDWFMDNNFAGSGTPFVAQSNQDGPAFVILNDGFCPADTAFYSIVHPTDLVPVLQTVVSPICVPSNINFTDATNQVANVNYSITWEISNGHSLYIGQNVNGGQSLDYTLYDAGTYDVTMTLNSSDGCVYTKPYFGVIQTYGPPKVAFTPNPSQITSYEPSSTMINLTSSDAVSYVWDFGPLAEDRNPTDEEPTVTYPDGTPGKYPVSLTATNAKGCTATAFGEVQIINEVNIFAPNAFTPDGNNFNEKWRVYISGIDIYDFKLTIYNRYGETVWQSFDSEAGWDGTYGNNGKPVLDGTYPWIITAKDAIDDTVYEFKGAVNILK